MVFDSNDEESVAVKDNIEYVLKSINVKTKEQEVIVPEDEEEESLDIDEDGVEIETISATTNETLYSFQEYFA